MQCLTDDSHGSHPPYSKASPTGWLMNGPTGLICGHKKTGMARSDNIGINGSRTRTLKRRSPCRVGADESMKHVGLNTVRIQIGCESEEGSD